MNFNNWLRVASKELKHSESPRLDSEILLEYVTGKTRSWIIMFGETLLTKTQMERLAILLSHRKKGVPIAYLTGDCEFWSLPLHISPVTLIPRPETECLVEQTLARLPLSSCWILDLGTGTGAIALALASERPDCQIVAIDLVSEVVQLARINVKRLYIQNVCVIQSCWFDKLSRQKFDIIVSNPPYIDRNDPHLLQGDVRFEPRIALVSAEGGLADICYIIAASRQYLNSHSSWLIIEHGWTQGDAVRKIFINAGFRDVKTCRDYSGNDRLTLGRWV